MKIKFWGTAAAEGIPAVFCDCEACQYSRAHGGRNIRTRSQAIIDDRILIEMGPDTLMHILAYHFDISHLEHCLITHTHDDHFAYDNFYYRRRGFANLADGTLPLTAWGGEELGECLKSDPDGKVNPDGSVLYSFLPPLTPTVLHDSVAGDYEVTALPATHGTKTPYNYIIRNVRENKALLYAHDTSPYRDEKVWQYFADSGVHLDLVSMDCTLGNVPGDHHGGHMNLVLLHRFKDRLFSLGAVDNSTVFVANHFSHNGKDSPYDTMIDPAVNGGDLIISYDGMELVF